jgi:hypothetical protein
LSPTIQQHWRRRGHGPFPFGSIFFHVKDAKGKFIRSSSPAQFRYLHSQAPHSLKIILFFPPQLLLVPPLKVVLFTRVKLPEVMEMPV